VPLHWFWGSYAEEPGVPHFYAFAPGRYVASIRFREELAIAAGSFEFQVRERTVEEERAREAFLAGASRARAEVLRSGQTDSALGTLLAFLRDEPASPYTTLLLCDLATGLQGVARSTSRRYRTVVDSLRAERVGSRSDGTPDQVRLVESLTAERLDSLVLERPALLTVPLVDERLRSIRRERDRH